MIAAFFVYCYGLLLLSRSVVSGNIFFHSRFIPQTLRTYHGPDASLNTETTRKATLFALNHSPVAVPTLQADKLQDRRSALVVNTDREELMCPWKS